MLVLTNRQRVAGVPFEKTVLDFQLLLHASSVLSPTSITTLCSELVNTGTTQKARARRSAVIEDARCQLYAAAGLEAAS